MFRELGTIVVRIVRNFTGNFLIFGITLRVSPCTGNFSMKRVKLDMMRIGTHSGVFHCDDALACFMLKCLPKYKSAEIIRSRDEKKLAECDVVVDVGGVYDPSRERYDHHQRGFTETLSSVLPKFGAGNTIKLSSAGLVYAHHGHNILREVLKTEKQKEFADDVLDKLYMKVYKSFVEEIDAIDNGVNMFEGAEPKYSITTNLSSRVSYLNAPWYEENSEEIAYAGFQKAISLVGEEFFDRIFQCALSWWPARSIVQEAIGGRYKVHASGLILELERFCPWNEHFFELEAELQIPEKPLYVIFADSSNGWRVRAIPVSPTSFELRKALPERLRGLRDADLVKLTGIETITFVHMSGFIGGAQAKEDAVKLAELALQE